MSSSAMEIDEDINNDEAARAFAAISEQLDSWTSPRRPRMLSSSESTTTTAAAAVATTDTDMDYATTYTQDSVQWVKGLVREDSSGTLTPQKRASSSSGATTPIMSNAYSSSGGEGSRGGRSKSPRLVTMESADDVPWIDKTMTTTALPTTTATSTRSSVECHDFRRYHDTLLIYLANRRSLADQQRLQQQLDATTTNIMQTDDTTSSQEVEKEERAELEFLQSLASSSSSVVVEGSSSHQHDLLVESHVWSLLFALRSHGGIDALLWKPPFGGGHVEISNFLNKLAARGKTATPGELIQDLYYPAAAAEHSELSSSSSSSPPLLILQRRKTILEWLEQCHVDHLGDIELPTRPPRGAMWPDTLERLRELQQKGQQATALDPNKVTSLDPDAPLRLYHGLSSSTSSSSSAAASEPLYGRDNENEKKLLKACLAYILAGRLDEAMGLCDRQGQPWRCSAWGGGQPYDFELIRDDESQQVRAVQVGNRHRALWKRTCWSIGRSNNGAVTTEEFAINSIFSNDVETALKNPALRTLESGLYVCFSAMLGRLEDDLLRRHNVFMRKSLPKEEEQLKATEWIAMWNESSILDQLDSSPFEEMRPTGVLGAAMASFLVGKDDVLKFVAQESNKGQPQDLRLLRFLAHLLLYLDSLSVGVTATSLPGVNVAKNRFVLQYLQELGVRPELWNLMALYASLLPMEIVMEEYPPILCNIQDDDKRASMCKQMHKLLPAGMDLMLLRRVVRLLLGNADPHVYMRSISWLCHFDSHLPDALVCTNMLLRKEFLADDLPEALTFLDQYLPRQVTDFAASTERVECAVDAVNVEDVKRSKLEFGGLQHWLEAYKAFRHWEQVIGSTPPITVTSKIAYDRAALNRTELEISNSHERQELVKLKRKSSRKVVEAADVAQRKLLEVLTYPGGWLLEEDSENRNDDGEESKQRRKELEDIQSVYLPRAAFMVLTLADKTAAWMADSLDEAVTVLGKAALSKLDDPSSDSTSPLSPLYWIRSATSLGEIVASGENNVCSTFSEENEKTLLSGIAESETRELRYEKMYELY